MENKERGNTEAVAFAWQVYSSVAEWTRFADAKAGAVLGIHALMWGFLASNTGEYGAWLASGRSCWWTVGALAFALAGLVSVALAILCVEPSLKLRAASSRVYFASIATRISSSLRPTEHEDKARAYADELAMMDDYGRLHEVAEQVLAMSAIATRKYRLVWWSSRGLYIAFAIFVVGTVIMLMGG